MIKSGVVRTALVVGGERISPYMNWDDRNVAVLFGDGAAAVVLQATDDDVGVMVEKLGCYGDSRDILRIHGIGGAYVHQDRLTGVTEWQFEGQEIFKKAVTGMGNACEDVLQRAGKTPDDEKEEIYNAFAGGSLRVLVIKPKIGAWGLNWQHCNHVVTFASHSYEQYYQSVRRCWRFGQKNPVQLDVVATEGESRVMANMRRKADQAEVMFLKLVEHMNRAIKIERENKMTKKVEVPSWL
jgi:hypothetical protein